MRCLFALLCIFLANPRTFAGPADGGPADKVEYTITTAAGSAWVGDGGPSTAALLVQTEGVAADLNGNLYIADAGDHRVRRVSPDGVIRTIAGTGIRGFSGDGGSAAAAQLNAPYGLACDVRGNLYIADLGNARVRRVTPDGTIATIAGGGVLLPGGANEGSPAVRMALSAPRNLALDPDGNLFISDFSGHRVYRLGTDGTLTTAAGTGVAGNSGDGAAAWNAQLAFPAGLAFDRQQPPALYIADSQNHTIRKVARGVISSFARVGTPAGLAFDGWGALFVADVAAGQVVKIPPVGAIATIRIVAHDLAFSVDGALNMSTGTSVAAIAPSGATMIRAGGGDTAHGDQGDARSARLNHPSGVAMDAAGNLYIADRDNHRVRRVSVDGTIVTLAGTGVQGDSGDGGSATQAQLNAPHSVSIDSSGNVYIADTGNHRVREVTPGGRIVAAVSSGLLSPVYAIPDAAGNIYIADADAGKILKAGSNGVPATLLSGLASPRGLALDQKGNLYFTEAAGARVHRLSPDGQMAGVADGAWNIPRGVAVDDAGNVFVADTGLQQIIRVDPAGRMAVVAGTGTQGFSGDRGGAADAQLGYPWDVAVGDVAVGNAALGPGGTPAAGQRIAIADLDNNRIRALEPAASQILGNIGLAADAVNAASLLPGPVAPGMLVLLRNTGVDPSQLAGTLVLFGAWPARILAADAAGLLTFAPLEIAGAGSAAIHVFSQGALRVSIPITVADTAPGLFAAVSNEDGSLNSPDNAAARGTIISLYGTGLGITGAPVSVTVAGYPAEALYAGPVSGFPGLFQINARIPGGYLPAGGLAVVVTAGQVSSQPGVSAWVK